MKVTVCTNEEHICNGLIFDKFDSELSREEIAGVAVDAGLDEALDLNVEYSCDHNFKTWNGGPGHGRLAYSYDDNSEATIAKIEGAMRVAAEKARLKDRISFNECAIEQWSDDEYENAGLTRADLEKVVAEAKTELAKMN